MLAELTRPTRASSIGFWLRSHGLMLRQGWRNRINSPSRRWLPGIAMVSSPILVQVRTPLWSSELESEFILVAGKVHNLRLAAKCLHAVEIPAGECFSFWKQLGRPSARRGFVVGREIREGCVIPALAGGICQISNALATAASRAGFQLVERHAHSARVAPASAHASDDSVDATVFWNYVDLKILAPVSWRLELTLSATELVLTIRGVAAGAARLIKPSPDKTVSLRAAEESVLATRSCLSCGQLACFRRRSPALSAGARTAWLLDLGTPEFARYLATQSDDADCFLPAASHPWFPLPASSHRFFWTGLMRRLWLRRWARHPGKRQASVIDGQRWLAQAYARKLQPTHTHLIIDQGLLPHLRLAGVLDGRTYDVLASALPMSEIQRRLNLAQALCATSATLSTTLNDFRVNPLLAASECAAMADAHQIVTAHAEVASYWRARGARDVVQMPWVFPEAPLSKLRDRAARLAELSPASTALIVFPASALARKGVGELAQAVHGLNVRVRVLGSSSSDDALWSGVEVDYAGYASDWLTQAAVVVLPAHIEHSPRALLQAVAAGIPVIATSACGLSNLAGVTPVNAGDVAGLRRVLREVLLRLPNQAMPLDHAVLINTAAASIEPP